MNPFFTLAIILAAIVFYRILFSWRGRAWPKSALALPRFQAHRGDWKVSGAQENTLSAFRSAKTGGSEMSELDVQLSGDGEVVVFHDYDLARLGRSSALVKSMSADQLHTAVKAPRLREVLLDPNVTSKVNIEIKSNRFGDGELERRVAGVVREAKCEGRVLFSSFNPFVLGRLAKHLPDVPRALLVSEESDPGNKLWLKKMLLGFYAKPHLLHLHRNMLSPKRVQGWKKRGLRVAVWTVNDPLQAKTYFEWGVDSVISDEVAKLRAALEN